MRNLFDFCVIALIAILMILLIVVVSSSDFDLVDRKNDLIEECEHDLPRNQNCTIEMKAVPEDSKDD